MSFNSFPSQWRAPNWGGLSLTLSITFSAIFCRFNILLRRDVDLEISKSSSCFNHRRNNHSCLNIGQPQPVGCWCNFFTLHNSFGYVKNNKFWSPIHWRFIIQVPPHTCIYFRNSNCNILITILFFIVDFHVFHVLPRFPPGSPSRFLFLNKLCHSFQSAITSNRQFCFVFVLMRAMFQKVTTLSITVCPISWFVIWFRTFSSSCRRKRKNVKTCRQSGSLEPVIGN